MKLSWSLLLKILAPIVIITVLIIFRHPIGKALAPGLYTEVKVSYGCSATHPIRIDITNNSSREITAVEYAIIARRPGHSTDYLSDEPWLTSDDYLKPGQHTFVCWNIPAIAGANASWEYEMRDWRIHYQ